MVTWLCALGFARGGDAATAATLQAQLRHYTAQAGLAEYCDPRTGEPLGAASFSWAAALTLWNGLTDA